MMMIIIIPYKHTFLLVGPVLTQWLLWLLFSVIQVPCVHFKKEIYLSL